MGKSHYIIPIFVPHEGCPHNCVFCNQSRITGESLKIKENNNDPEVNEEYVERTIEEYLTTIKNPNATIEVSFFGGTFTAIDIEKQRSLLKVAKRYKDDNKIHFIRMSTRPDYIDEHILSHLKNYNADIIELGVQSLDEEVLQKSGRGHSLQDVEKASKLIKDYGFTLGHQIMLGLPGDDFYKDIKTTELSIKMKPDICRIYPSLVIKDTPMEELYNRGEYKPYTLEETIKISKVLYAEYVANDVNVIRIGLQPTENIAEGKDIVAGPFHPAIRELVEGSLLNDIIYDISTNIQGNFKIKLNPKDISKIYANKKIYFNELVNKLGTKKVEIMTTENLNRGEIAFLHKNEQYKMSIINILREKVKEGKNSLS